MGNQVFIIKRNDTLPSISINIKTMGSLGQKESYNLSGLSYATFSMVDDCNNLKVYAQSAETVCSTNGVIEYNWQDGDTDTAGTYYGEFELTFVDGKRMSIPQLGGIKIEIVEDINSF